MSLTFNEFADRLASGDLPKWLIDHALASIGKIADALQANKIYKTTGPQGETVEIRWTE